MSYCGSGPSYFLHIHLKVFSYYIYLLPVEKETQRINIVDQKQIKKSRIDGDVLGIDINIKSNDDDNFDEIKDKGTTGRIL